MKPLLFLFAAALLTPALLAQSAPARPDLVILDEIGVQNLGIETAVAEPGEFEETIFALGRIAVYPGRRAVVGSRIPGRAVEVFVKHDHAIEQGAPAVVVESRQFATPPPTVTLPAPLSGLVSSVEVVPGQPVSPDDVLAEILDLREVYALAQVPEHLAGRLERGQMARIHVPAVPGQVFEARLEHLGVVADSESGTIEAAFHVENPDLILRPGMRAEFSIVVSRRTDVVSVPRSALQGDPANRYVFVRDFDLPNAFIRTPVVTGMMNEQRVEIVRGLLPADEVVVQGAYPLAFAGGGSVSLKEALDAAHGHEHNPDGSEITPGQQTGPAHAAHDHLTHRPSPFWMIVSAVLAVLLVLVSLRRRPSAGSPAPTSDREPEARS